jgi:hypothetical protein
MAEEKTKDFVQELAEKLGETEPYAVQKIALLVKLAGEDFTKSLVEESLQIDANGGQMTLDGSRRRTLGGVFFYLAKGKLPKELKHRIFPMQKKQKSKASPQATQTDKLTG